MSTARCPSLGSNAGVAIYGENRQPAPMSNRPFDLVIFDCDGVLVDSEPIHQPGPCPGADRLRLSDHRRRAARALLRDERR